MESECKFKTKKTYFNIDREGWLLFLLLSIIQAFVWYASYMHSNSPSALNYVSFSGTLISIILAVLAIGYTYGESVKQKNESGTLSSQLENLVKITKKLKTSSDSFEELDNIKSSLGKIANKIEDGFDKTDKTVSKIQDIVIENLRADKIINLEANKNKDATISELDTFREILKRSGSTTHTDLLITAIGAKNIDATSYANQISPIVLWYQKEFEDNNEKKTSFDFGLSLGSILGLSSILISLGILKTDNSKFIPFETEVLKIIKTEITEKESALKKISCSEKLVSRFQDLYANELSDINNIQ